MESFFKEIDKLIIESNEKINEKILGINYLEKLKFSLIKRIIDLNISRYGIFIRVKGGGKEAQMDAIQLGIARALVLEQGDRRSSLKSAGFLKRDPRKKERKKYGLRGARRGFQFSKR